uniref:Uncharacterized protein n=1 Tax=Eutreptiella gymnastica TaxID=73025 RepID=A0A7S4LA78_9EUGL
MMQNSGCTSSRKLSRSQVQVHIPQGGEPRSPLPVLRQHVAVQHVRVRQHDGRGVAHVRPLAMRHVPVVGLEKVLPLLRHEVPEGAQLVLGQGLRRGHVHEVRGGAGAVQRR